MLSISEYDDPLGDSLAELYAELSPKKPFRDRFCAKEPSEVEKFAG